MCLPLAAGSEDVRRSLPSDSNAIPGEVDADHVSGEEVVPNESIESWQGDVPDFKPPRSEVLASENQSIRLQRVAQVELQSNVYAIDIGNKDRREIFVQFEGYSVGRRRCGGIWSWNGRGSIGLLRRGKPGVDQRDR